ncbi:replication associated [Labeo rohita]|uniref:ATP-dependent helicase Rep n=1 Tax=Labeo rohita TaxID=84645 RepID=A0A498NTT0_LABRO|nr:replication associated [Labeo rohita]
MPKALSKTRHLEAPRQNASGREQPVKQWCFTLNNPTADELRHIKEVVSADSVDFAVIRQEVGDRGMPHLQGFLNMKTKRRLNTMKNWLSSRAHYEVARGTDLQNDEYCSKEGNVYLRIGEPVRERQWSDLQKAIEVAKKSSGSLKAVAEACPSTFIRCGKSKMAAELCAGSSTYYKPCGPWWDGYDGHVCVVIDDLYGWMSCDELWRVCDRYPCKVPVKGAFVEFVAKSIYITSNRHVWEWYHFDGFVPSAVLRRVNVYFVFDEAMERFTDLCSSPMYDPLTMRYNYYGSHCSVLGQEVGESGTPYLQGFVNLKTKRCLSMMKNWLSPRAHFEAVKGTDLQNDEYCTKGGDIYLRI